MEKQDVLEQIADLVESLPYSRARIEITINNREYTLELTKKQKMGFYPPEKKENSDDCQDQRS